ncbi:MAG: 4Fe-4S dicluster domain-containing protein [Deltaproteobacteria bacterium]|nr:4Fe-4S dicluster domain-containing protein [Deltaproteobacteria bacterium]
MTNIKQIEENLKREAKRLLESKEVSVVLAYARGYDEHHPLPYAARTAGEVGNLIFNEYCTYNLARYLTKYPPKTKIAIAVKAADSRAVVQLIQEEKVKKEDLVILGIPFIGMKDPKTGEEIDQKTTCHMANPVLYDILLGEEIRDAGAGSPYDVLAELEAMDQAARWSFWEKEFSKCIRCFACRKACPMCYCDPCFMDASRPRWADKSPTADGNLMYHLTRFYHLAGRCIDCGECSRACPMDIPLHLFHKKMAKECETMFGQAAGMKIDDKPVMVNYGNQDSDEMLK